MPKLHLPQNGTRVRHSHSFSQRIASLMITELCKRNIGLYSLLCAFNDLGYDTCRPGRGEWYFPLIVTVLFGYLSEPLCLKWLQTGLFGQKSATKEYNSFPSNIHLIRPETPFILEHSINY